MAEPVKTPLVCKGCGLGATSCRCQPLLASFPVPACPCGRSLVPPSQATSPVVLARGASVLIAGDHELRLAREVITRQREVLERLSQEVTNAQQCLPSDKATRGYGSQELTDALAGVRDALQAAQDALGEVAHG
jgi:hypothetical protein